MSLHLTREIEKLKKMILSLSALVEEDVERATRSISERAQRLADEVIKNDVEIDHADPHGVTLGPMLEPPFLALVQLLEACRFLPSFQLVAELQIG